MPKLIQDNNAPTCEFCTKPPVTWSGRSRTYFRSDTKSAVVIAGWCEDHQYRVYDNPGETWCTRMRDSLMEAK